MTRTNISSTKQALEQRDDIDQFTMDGDTATEEAVFRALLDGNVSDDFEQFVEDELDVEITKTKWVVFGEEVVMR